MAVVDMNEWERGNREEMSVRSVSWRKHRLAWHLVLTAPFPQPPLPYTHKLHRLSNTRPFSGQCRKINSGKAALFSLLLFGYSEDAERYSRYQRQCHFSYVTTTVWEIKCEFLKTYYIQVSYVWVFFSYSRKIRAYLCLLNTSIRFKDNLRVAVDPKTGKLLSKASKKSLSNSRFWASEGIDTI